MTTSDPLQPAWTQAATGKVYIEFRIRRTTLIAIIGSLILHALLLFFITHERILPDQPSTKGSQSPLVVQLNPQAAPEQTETLNEQTPSPSRQRSVPVPKHPPKVRKTPIPPVMAVSRPKPETPSVNPSTPTLPFPQAAKPSAPTDMMSYVNASRQRREQEETNAAQENTIATTKEQAPSESERRDKIIASNLNPGQNGIFQILSKTSHDATFAFRGWTTDASNSRREVVQVEVTGNEDIDHAIVRKMLDMIRRYYKDTFPWESQRLGRVVDLSAKPQDSAAVEAFLINEFFGGNGIPAY